MSYIVNNGIKVHYKIEGAKTKKPIVLVHGFLGSLEDWYEYDYVDKLKDDYCLILVDARGHGKSEKSIDKKKYEHKERVLDIIRILDKEKIEKAHYVGYSMGGWIGIGLIKWYENRLNSIVINSVHPFATDMSLLAHAAKTIESWIHEMDMSPAMKRRFLSNDKEALLAAVADNRIDNAETMKKMKIPCLMMYGEYDDIKENMIKASQLNDIIKLVEIPGADHMGALAHSTFVISEMKKLIEL